MSVIKSQHQYTHTRKQATMWREVKRQVERMVGNYSISNPEAVLQQLENHIAGLELAVREFDDAVAMSPVDELRVISEAPGVLIRARLRAGLSQEQLAQRIGMSRQSITKYENQNYDGASLKTVRSIIAVLLPALERRDRFQAEALARRRDERSQREQRDPPDELDERDQRDSERSAFESSASERRASERLASDWTASERMASERSAAAAFAGMISAAKRACEIVAPAEAAQEVR